jgi:hypothetical protein
MVLGFRQHHALACDEFGRFRLAAFHRHLDRLDQRLPKMADDLTPRRFILRDKTECFTQVSQHLDVAVGLFEIFSHSIFLSHR